MKVFISALLLAILSAVFFNLSFRPLLLLLRTRLMKKTERSTAESFKNGPCVRKVSSLGLIHQYSQTNHAVKLIETSNTDEESIAPHFVKLISKLLPPQSKFSYTLMWVF